MWAYYISFIYILNNGIGTIFSIIAINKGITPFILIIVHLLPGVHTSVTSNISFTLFGVAAIPIGKFVFCSVPDQTRHYYTRGRILCRSAAEVVYVDADPK